MARSYKIEKQVKQEQILRKTELTDTLCEQRIEVCRERLDELYKSDASLESRFMLRAAIYSEMSELYGLKGDVHEASVFRKQAKEAYRNASMTGSKRK
jgi:hypothetical protein